MDLTERLSTAASAVGILASALPDALARGQRQFTLPPTDAEVEAWAQSLRTSCPHFFPAVPPPPGAAPAGVPVGVPEELWRSMSPSSKLAWAREHGYALKPVERRPKPLTLTSEQAAQLATLPPLQRLAAYRALQEGGKP